MFTMFILRGLSADFLLWEGGVRGGGGGSVNDPDLHIRSYGHEKRNV